MSKILVVDDERHIRELYSLELSAEGYDVETRGSCKSLQRDIETSKPDLIILDIRLVNDDGLEQLLEIREHYPDIPVIMCSPYDSFRDDVRTIAADAYVVKSFDLSQLKMKIRRALEGKLPASLTLLPQLGEFKNGKAKGAERLAMMRGVECTGLQ